MSALASAGVEHMTTREPSLEELFVSHYGDGPTAPATGPMSTTGGADHPPTPRDASRRTHGCGRRDGAFRQVWIGATVCAVVFGARRRRRR